MLNVHVPYGQQPVPFGFGFAVGSGVNVPLAVIVVPHKRPFGSTGESPVVHPTHAVMSNNPASRMRISSFNLDARLDPGGFPGLATRRGGRDLVNNAPRETVSHGCMWNVRC